MTDIDIDMSKEPLVSGNLPSRTYSLVGKPSKAWFSYLIKGQAGQCLMFLAALPFGMALMCYLALEKNPSQVSIQLVIMMCLLTLPAAFGCICLWGWTFKEHLRRARSVSISPNGLELNSLRSTTQLAWHEILAVFPSANSNEVAVWSRKGDFYISREMEGSEQLVAEIGTHIQKKSNYETSFCRDEAYVPQIAAACFALAYAVLLPLARQFGASQITKQAMMMGADVVIFSIFVVCCLLGALYLFLAKVPNCVRLGPDGMLIRDGEGVHG